MLVYQVYQSYITRATGNISHHPCSNRPGNILPANPASNGAIGINPPFLLGRVFFVVVLPLTVFLLGIILICRQNNVLYFHDFQLPFPLLQILLQTLLLILMYPILAQVFILTLWLLQSAGQRKPYCFAITVICTAPAWAIRLTVNETCFIFATAVAKFFNSRIN